MNKEHHEHYRLYLETNRSFVAEKFQELFKVELQEEDPRINHINQNKLEKLVREVLSFEGNPELQRFYAELSSNIAKFCQQDKPLDDTAVIELMIFCLEQAFEENGDGNKGEDSDNQNNKEEPSSAQPQKEQLPQPEVEKVDVGGVLQQTIQKYEELLQQSTLSRDERFVLESSLANMRMQQATIRGIPRHRKAQSVVEISNSQEIENPESLKLPTPTKREILLKRLKPIFKFACREQQTTGINTTFDRINQECSIMNLGKFLMFCNAVKVPSEKLTRFVLIEKFKKNAEGFRDINFDKFVELLDTLQQIDSTLYDRIVVHDSPVAKSRLKSVRTPFAIHEKEYFRELRMPVTARKQLTSHSGQMSYSLREELHSRKMLKSQKQRYGEAVAADMALMISNNSFHGQAVPTEMMQASRLSESTQERTVYTIEQLKGVANEIELKRLSRLIVHDDEDDEFMRSYKVEQFKNRRNSNLITNIRKRAHEIERQEQEREQRQKLDDPAANRSRLR